MTRFTRGRRRSSVVLGAAVVALAFGVSVGLAKSGPSQYSHLKLFVDPPPAVCPPLVKGKDPHSFGQASLERSKGTFTVRVHMRGAAPGPYFVVLGLFDPIGGFCTVYGPMSGLTTFNVNSSGDGNGSGTFADDTIPAGGFFVVGAFREDLLAGYVSNPVKLGST